MNHWQQQHSRYTINHNIKHPYKDSCLHTMFIWKIGSLRLSILTYFKIPFTKCCWVGTWHPDPIYRVETWHIDPIIPCWNVTLRSNNIMSERDTPIKLFHYFISSSLLYSRRHFNREGSRLEIQQYHNFRPTTSHTIKTYNLTMKYIGDFTISLNTYRSLFKVYLSHRNKP